MILKARHHFIVYPFFRKYALWAVGRKFSQVKIVGEFNDRGLPVLLIANHISWWDGFWAMVLNLKVLHRKFHFMMQQDQLQKYWFFNYTGGYSVAHGSRSVVETLDYTAGLLGEAGNMVLLFPQGKLQSMHCQSFRFEKGVERILKGKEAKVQVLMMASLIDYFARPKPGLYLYLQEFDGRSFVLEDISDAYQAFYGRCVSSQNSQSQ